MSLFRGRLYAGALFAGLLFGPSQTEEPAPQPAQESGGGGQYQRGPATAQRKPPSYRELLDAIEARARLAAPVPPAVAPTPPVPLLAPVPPIRADARIDAPAVFERARTAIGLALDELAKDANERARLEAARIARKAAERADQDARQQTQQAAHQAAAVAAQAALDATLAQQRRNRNRIALLTAILMST